MILTLSRFPPIWPCDPGSTLKDYGGPLMPAPAANRRSVDSSSGITLKQTMEKVVQSFSKVNCSWYKSQGTNFAFGYQVVGARAFGGIAL